MKHKRKLGPRNPLVGPSLFRKAGAHRKTLKAVRAQEKVDVRRIAQVVEQSAFNRKAVGSIPSAPTISRFLWGGLSSAG